MKRSSIIVSAVLFAGIAIAGGGLAMFKHRALNPPGEGMGGFEPVEAVQVVAARQVQWHPTANLVGTVLSLRSVQVSNEQPGVIKEVLFDSGAIVEAGQLLLTLDDATDRADLAAAEANVRVAEANLAVVESRVKLAETEMRRRVEAQENSAVTAIEMERATSELEAARADRDRYVAEVDLAKARVAQAQTRLDKMAIKAPFRARAGLRTVHEGQYLAEGATVVMLEEVSDKTFLDFAIPQEYLARVHAGTVVMATSPILGPDPVRIEVVALDATVNNQTRNVRVRSIIDNPDSTLRPGMFIPISVPADEPRPYIVVPVTAVRRSSYADQVFVIVAGEAPGQWRAKQRFVKLGPTVDENVIVLEGLSEGEQVAAVGSFKLRDGALVRIVEAEAVQSPPSDAWGGEVRGGDVQGGG